MTIRRTALLAMRVFLACVLSSCASTRPDDAPYNETKYGCIAFDSSGPVEGATVYLVTSGGLGITETTVEKIGVTNRDGGLHIPGPAARRVIGDAKRSMALVATHPNHAVSWLTIIDEGCLTGGKLVMSAQAPITGTVTDTNGTPLRGATVGIDMIIESGLVMTRMSMSYGNAVYLGNDMENVTVTTDDNGRFSLPYAPEHAWVYLYAEAPGYNRAVKRTINSDSRRLSFSLAPAGKITGRVVRESDGAPAAGITVVARPEDKKLMAASGRAVTDRRGRYAITGLGAGKYNVFAGGDGASDLVVCDIANATVTAGATTENVTLKVNGGGFVSDRVTDSESGEPLAGFPIGVYTRLGQAFNVFKASTISGPDGTYHVRVPAGEVDVSVFPPLALEHYLMPPVKRNIAVEAGETTSGVDYRPEKGLFIAGVVTDNNGDAVPDVLVLGNNTLYPWQGYTRSNEDGAFRAGPFPRDVEVSYLAVHKDRHLMKRGTFSTLETPEKPVTIELEPFAVSTVTGMVVDGDDNPVSGMEITLWSVNARFGMTVAESGQDGRFSITGLTNGETYRVFMMRGQQSSGDFIAGEPVEPIQFVAPKAERWLAGAVADEHGIPIQSAEIIINASRSGFARATSDDSGAFRVESLVPLVENRVMVRHPKYGEYSFRFLKTNHRHTLTLYQEKSVSGTVLDTKGEPVKNALVYVPNPENSRDYMHRRTQTGPDGTFEFKTAVDIVDISVSHHDIGQCVFKGLVAGSDNNTLTLIPQDQTHDEEWEYQPFVSLGDGSPPKLSPSCWVNGEPVTLDELGDRMVILTFCSCGNRRSIYALSVADALREYYGEKLAVVGIHPATEDIGTVETALHERGISFPVMIDFPSDETGSCGRTHDDYGVNDTVSIIIGSDGSIHPDVSDSSLEQVVMNLMKSGEER